MGFQEKLEWLNDSGVSVVALQHLLDKATTSKDLSVGALNYTTSISDKWKIVAVLVHASAALSDTEITVSFNSETGANYDTVLGKLDFDGEQDLAFIGGDNMKAMVGEDGDEITIVSSGTDATGVLYVTIMYELLV